MLPVHTRRLVVLFAALTAVVLTGYAGVTTTSGPTGVGVQNRVWAFTPAAQLLAPPTTSQSPCSSPGLSASTIGMASGFCVATEETVSAGARDAAVETTQAGERFVRVGARPQNLNFTFDTPGGVRAGTYAFPEETFNQIGFDPAALKNFGDLPGEPPTVYRTLEPPAGTPIQRGVVPGGEFGGEGGVPEVFFPEGF